MHASVLSHVQLFCNPMDFSTPGSSVHGILQARILEWVASYFSRGSSPPRDWTHVSCSVRQILYHLSHLGSPIPYVSIIKKQDYYQTLLFLLGDVWPVKRKLSLSPNSLCSQGRHLLNPQTDTSCRSLGRQTPVCLWHLLTWTFTPSKLGEKHFCTAFPSVWFSLCNSGQVFTKQILNRIQISKQRSCG